MGPDAARTARAAALGAAFFLAALAAGFGGAPTALVAVAASAPRQARVPGYDGPVSPAAMPSAAPVASAQPSASAEPTASPVSSSPVESPTPAATVIPPSPVPVQLAVPAVHLILGHSQSVRVLSPASGILILSGFDPGVVRAIFNPIDRTLDLTGLRPGSTVVTTSDEFGLSATLSVTVQAYAGKAYAATSVTITGDPASARYVAESAADAAKLIAYPEPGATVLTDPQQVRQAVELAPDQSATVIVPLSIAGPGYAPYHQDVTVAVNNLAQPPLPPKVLLVSDFPETITENGTLFYADVAYAQPARLLYYHYNERSSGARRVLVRAQNNGIESSFLELISGIAGPSSNVLAVGHESTMRFLIHDAHSEGRVFEVPPHATVNISDQPLPPGTLVSGLMQLRVISGSDVRVAVVVQDASEIPVGPISETLLSSAVRHARGIYSVPDFEYDISYAAGDDPAELAIGKLPLPNLVQGEVLGGDYGVKQSASVTLLNPNPADARVGMWVEARGGRATGTFIIDGDLIQLHPLDVGKPALLRVFNVPATGYARASIVTMPEGGSSYPLRVIFGSSPPPGGGWNLWPGMY